MENLAMGYISESVFFLFQRLGAHIYDGVEPFAPEMDPLSFTQVIQ